MIQRMIDYSEVKYLISKSISKINTMFIGVISNANHESGRYDVQPILKEETIDGSYVDKAILVRCPMCFTKTKNFYIRAPYEIGDVVYVGCSKTSIDYALSDNTTKQNKEDYQFPFREIDGIILGGVMTSSESSMSSENTEDFIIQNRNNGDTVILQKSGGATIKTSSQITLDTPVTNITGDVNISGKTTMSGELTVNSSITASSGITGQTVTNGNGIDIGTHTHEYISPSGIKQTGVGE